MARIEGLTKERMLEIEAASIVGGAVILDDLILTRHDGTTINAGEVKGEKGDPGAPGNPGAPGLSPSGSVVLFSGANADIPSGWINCDGRTVSRATYPALFAILGTRYGAGDGTTTFNLPNFKGKVPVGHDTTQTEFDTLGEVGGAKTHTLALTEMPSHAHTHNAHTHSQNAHYHGVNDHSHAPAALSNFMTLGTIARTRLAAGTATSPIAVTATDTAQLGINNTRTAVESGLLTAWATPPDTNSTTSSESPRGGGEAHNNLQPYIVMIYIIKT